MSDEEIAFRLRAAVAMVNHFLHVAYHRKLIVRMNYSVNDAGLLSYHPTVMRISVVNPDA